MNIDNETMKAIREFTVGQKLASFDRDIYELPGIKDNFDRNRLVHFIEEALSEVIRISLIKKKQIAPESINPSHPNFDPIAMALNFYRTGHLDEACWLLFLSAYVGKHRRDHWQLLKAIYFGLDNDVPWSWKRCSGNVDVFREWLLVRGAELKAIGKLGEMHKYTILDKNKITEVAGHLCGYLNWLDLHHGHQMLFKSTEELVGSRPGATFQELYRCMNTHTKFSKLIKLNYLTLLWNTGVARLDPNQMYLNDVLWPKKGAKWLFGWKNRENSINRLNELSVSLAMHLDIAFAPLVLQVGMGRWAKEKFGDQSRNFRRPPLPIQEPTT